MSNKVRKKKVHNSKERAYEMSRIYTSRYGVIRMDGHACMVYDFNKQVLIQHPTQLLRQQLQEVEHRWTIMLVVGCREANGKFKLVTDQMRFSGRRTQAQLQTFLAKEHSQLVLDCEEIMKVEYIGWIGAPSATADFIPEQVEVTFNQLGKHYAQTENRDR